MVPQVVPQKLGLPGGCQRRLKMSQLWRLKMSHFGGRGGELRVCGGGKCSASGSCSSIQRRTGDVGHRVITLPMDNYSRLLPGMQEEIGGSVGCIIAVEVTKNGEPWQRAPPEPLRPGPTLRSDVKAAALQPQERRGGPQGPPRLPRSASEGTSTPKRQSIVGVYCRSS